jgi:hypothetical protein
MRLKMKKMARRGGKKLNHELSNQNDNLISPSNNELGIFAGEGSALSINKRSGRVERMGICCKIREMNTIVSIIEERRQKAIVSDLA